MPTNRVRRRQDRREGLTGAWQFRLETGEWPGLEDLPDVARGELLDVLIAPEDTARAMWDDYGDEILEDWSAEHPGSRPWAWWAFSAPEPRRVIRGSALLKPTTTPAAWGWFWREHFGIPCFQQWRPGGATLPLVESEAAYVLRLERLVLGEREQIAAEAFEPEEYNNPFCVDEEDLRRLAPLARRDVTSGSAIVDPWVIRHALEDPDD